MRINLLILLLNLFKINSKLNHRRKSNLEIWVFIVLLKNHLARVFKIFLCFNNKTLPIVNFVTKIYRDWWDSIFTLKNVRPFLCIKTEPVNIKPSNNNITLMESFMNTHFFTNKTSKINTSELVKSKICVWYWWFFFHYNIWYSFCTWNNSSTYLIYSVQRIN